MLARRRTCAAAVTALLVAAATLVLDAEALDIDNLDFAIGRNTVLEFRDVGLILQV